MEDSPNIDNIAPSCSEAISENNSICNAVPAPNQQKTGHKGVRKSSVTKMKGSKTKHVSFSEKDNVIIPCSELYYSFVEQYDSKRYDLDHPRCPSGGAYNIPWGTKPKDGDVALAVAIRKASSLRHEVWREKTKGSHGTRSKRELAACKVPVVWLPDGSCSVYEFWNPFSSGVEFNRAFRRSDMTSEEMSGQSGSHTLGIMAVYSGGVQSNLPEVNEPYCVIENEHAPDIADIKRIRKLWEEDNTEEQEANKSKTCKRFATPAAEEAVIAAFKQPWETLDPNNCSYCLIEYCCDYESNLCNEAFSKFQGRDVALVRLTMREDMTAQAGLDYAMSAVNKFKGKCAIFIWASLPCTGGTGFQKVNRYLYANHWKTMAEHDRKFRLFHSNLVKLMLAVAPERLHFAFEWPQPNDWWEREEIKWMISTFSLRTLLFNGCMVGLRAFDILKPHKKAWRVEHNITKLHPLLCDKAVSYTHLRAHETS